MYNVWLSISVLNGGKGVYLCIWGSKGESEGEYMRKV